MSKSTAFGNDQESSEIAPETPKCVVTTASSTPAAFNQLPGDDQRILRVWFKNWILNSFTETPEWKQLKSELDSWTQGHRLILTAMSFKLFQYEKFIRAQRMAKRVANGIRYYWFEVFPDTDDPCDNGDNEMVLSFEVSIKPEPWSPWPKLSAETVRSLIEQFLVGSYPPPRQPDWWHATHVRLLQEKTPDAATPVAEAFRVFPEFDPIVHGGLSTADAVASVLKDRNGEPPEVWTRYFVLSPGASVCAGLFLAVPPPEFGDYVIAYDEVVQKNSDASKMAAVCAPKMNDLTFEKLLIDSHSGRITPMGMPKTVMRLYEEAFAKHGIFFTFDHVAVDPQQAITEIRDWIRLPVAPRRPELRLVVHHVPRLVADFSNYQYRTESDNRKAAPFPKTPVLDCLLMFAQWHRLMALPAKSPTDH